MHNPPPLDHVDYLSRLRLNGRSVVVLGGGEGIGKQTCIALSQAGAQVLCVDREADLCQGVAAEAGGIGHVADITSRAAMNDVFSHAQELFGSDFKGIVNVVGLAFVKPIEEIDDDIWQRQFDIVLRHAYLTLQIGAPMLAATGGGSITFVGSISGLGSVSGQTAYGSAKAALHHLVRGGANEFGCRKVRVNAVVPSFIRTPRMETFVSGEMWKRMAEIAPLGRVASPDEIASAILFLQSDLASYVSGAVFPVDGGVSALSPLVKF